MRVVFPPEALLLGVKVIMELLLTFAKKLVVVSGGGGGFVVSCVVVVKVGVTVFVTPNSGVLYGSGFAFWQE